MGIRPFTQMPDELKSVMFLKGDRDNQRKVLPE